METWEAIIQRDLKPFADPGTSIIFGRMQHRLTAEWIARRQPRTASFEELPDGQTKVVFLDRELSYRAFLSCAEMGDLLGLAGMMLQGAAPSFFVETRAAPAGRLDEAQSALILLQKSISELDYESTDVVFVTGDAGAGKTEVLRRLVRTQAELFLRGEVDCLYFYVNAQGRALARLDEALATELQDLRAHLTYHAVPALVRNGALVPVIDGFDELLGVLGYEDAFASLRRFLDELYGRGYIVASARSTYYQQEFLARASRSDLSGHPLEITPIDILPWEEQEFSDYVSRRYKAAILPKVEESAFVETLHRVFAPPINRSLRSKPFFVAKTADLVLEGVKFTESGLIDQLVAGYIERERSEKLLDRVGRPLLTKEQIQEFVQLVCDEMWFQETRVLDTETVRVVAEMVSTDEALADDVRRIIIERAPVMAFFAPAPGRDRIEFEHQLFLSYFLGNTLSDSTMRDAASLYSVLMRSPLPENAADFAAERLGTREASARAVVEKAGAACSLASTTSAQARENAGALVAAVLRRSAQLFSGPHLENTTIRNLIFADEPFDGLELSNCILASLEFRICDFSGVRILASEAKDVVFYEALIDPGYTRLELKGIDPRSDVQGLRIRNVSGVQRVYRHDAIIEALRNCGVPGLDGASAQTVGVDSEVVGLLEALMHKFERANVVWLADPQYRQLTAHPKWSEIEKLLLAASVLSEERGRQYKGLPRVALRRNYLPHQIMGGATPGTQVPDNVSRFWSHLRAKFPTAVETRASQ